MRRTKIEDITLVSNSIICTIMLLLFMSKSFGFTTINPNTVMKYGLPFWCLQLILIGYFIGKSQYKEEVNEG